MTDQANSIERALDVLAAVVKAAADAGVIDTTCWGWCQDDEAAARRELEELRALAAGQGREVLDVNGRPVDPETLHKRLDELMEPRR